MKIKEVGIIETVNNPHGVEAKLLYDTENATVTHLFLKPGEQLKRHITPVDVFFYVLEGTGIVEIGDENKEVRTDSLIESPKNIPHCWYNKSDKNLRFLVVKIPKQKEQTKII
ncbi:cupin domain-containing protein [Candidatus Bathyarchaeota archaeon]|nr:cupin domain-containing protein [Candidatus Bathyarchaeota archaeon]